MIKTPSNFLYITILTIVMISVLSVIHSSLAFIGNEIGIPKIHSVVGMNSVSIVYKPALKIKRTPPEPTIVKGIYVSAYTAGSEIRMNEIIALIKRTELNAIIFDMKDVTGNVFYDTDVQMAHDINAVEIRIKDISRFIQNLHDNDIYVIARLAMFKDNILFAKHPEWAIKNTLTGRMWSDYSGKHWMDPASKDVWLYNVTLAQEMADYGVDEINFDYIRFPSDGPMRSMKYMVYDGTKEKSEVMYEIFKYIRNSFNNTTVFLSADLFGLTTERDDGMYIGQKIVDAAEFFDFVSPMVYPSHYPAGYQGFEVPSYNVYPVVYQAISKGVKKLDGLDVKVRAKIRPWLQDFSLSVYYGPDKVRGQIDATEDAGGFGWLLWDPKNTYTESALNKI